MIVTQELAKKMWCPMSRSIWGSGDGGSVSGNRNEDGSLSKADKCCGVLCMMWRWSTLDQGFCGLAGVPNA